MLINENMTGRIINAANLDIGLLINFGETSLKWERITKFKNKENRQIFRIRVAIQQEERMIVQNLSWGFRRE